MFLIKSTSEMHVIQYYTGSSVGWPSGLRRRSSSQDNLPLTANVVGSSTLTPETLCEKVSSYLRKDGGSTQCELFWGLSTPIKLEKSLNNLKCVEMTLHQFNSLLWLQHTFQRRVPFLLCLMQFCNKLSYLMFTDIGVKSTVISLYLANFYF